MLREGSCGHDAAAAHRISAPAPFTVGYAMPQYGTRITVLDQRHGCVGGPAHVVVGADWDPSRVRASSSTTGSPQRQDQAQCCRIEHQCVARFQTERRRIRRAEIEAREAPADRAGEVRPGQGQVDVVPALSQRRRGSRTAPARPVCAGCGQVQRAVHAGVARTGAQAELLQRDSGELLADDEVRARRRVGRDDVGQLRRYAG